MRVKTEHPDGTFSVIVKPHIVMDFKIRVMPPNGAEIDLAKVRSFVLYLRQFFHIHRLTTDGFQSRYMQQLFRKDGLDAIEYSVDRDDRSYLALRGVYAERRISECLYEPGIVELLDLQRDVKRRKVDHPALSSQGGPGRKDVSDAEAQVIGQISADDSQGSLPLLNEDSDASSERVVVPVEPSGKSAVVAMASNGRLNWNNLEKNLTR